MKEILLLEIYNILSDKLLIISEKYNLEFDELHNLYLTDLKDLIEKEKNKKIDIKSDNKSDK